MTRSAAARLAWVLLGPTVVMVAASAWFGLTGGLGWTTASFFPVTIAFAVVGAVIAARTGNRIGWLFLAVAAVSALSEVARSYASRSGAAALRGAPWAAWVFAIVIASEGPMFFLTPLFSDGRPPSGGGGRS